MQYFHRSELALEMEKDEREFLGWLIDIMSTFPLSSKFHPPDPRSSLLTIGRIPMMNALQDYSRHLASQQPPIVHAQRDYQLACRNTCAFPVSTNSAYLPKDGTFIAN